jgi:hypothetical protein
MRKLNIKPVEPFVPNGLAPIGTKSKNAQTAFTEENGFMSMD